MTSCCTTGSCGSDCLQLTDREAFVCSTICESGEPLSFSAIRGAAGYHQEVLTRILKRLLNYGEIEKTDGRYRRKTSQ